MAPIDARIRKQQGAVNLKKARKRQEQATNARANAAVNFKKAKKKCDELNALFKIASQECDHLQADYKRKLQEEKDADSKCMEMEKTAAHLQQSPNKRPVHVRSYIRMVNVRQ